MSLSLFNQFAGNFKQNIKQWRFLKLSKLKVMSKRKVDSPQAWDEIQDLAGQQRNGIIVKVLAAHREALQNFQSPTPRLCIEQFSWNALPLPLPYLLLLNIFMFFGGWKYMMLDFWCFPPSFHHVLMKPICINLLHTKMLVDPLVVLQGKLQSQGNHPRVHGRLPHVESRPSPCLCGLFLLVQHHSHISIQFTCFQVSYPLV